MFGINYLKFIVLLKWFCIYINFYYFYDLVVVYFIEIDFDLWLIIIYKYWVLWLCMKSVRLYYFF